jgi:hypothetical protein
LGRVGGRAALDIIGDKYAAAAIGDTLFNMEKVAAPSLCAVRLTMSTIRSRRTNATSMAWAMV